MLKKILGGFSVLLLVFAIVMPLLVTTNTAYSTPNKMVIYYVITSLVCPDGSIIGSYSEWRSMLVTDSNHPPDWQFCFDTGQGIQCDPQHTRHWITLVINSSGRTIITKRASARACR